MVKIITAAVKELVLLKRDRTGLLVLFFMPALLVIVITLVQQNVMELTGQKKTQLLLLDLDEGELGGGFRRQLEAGNIAIVALEKERQKSSDLEAAVSGGDYQVGVIIPEGTSDKMQQETALLFQENKVPAHTNSTVHIPVQVLFDPAILPGLRSGLTAQIRMALETLAMQEKIKYIDKTLKGLMANLGMTGEAGSRPGAGLAESIGQPLFILEEKHTGSGRVVTPPYNPVQQNVPAWALFGMFFTAIPIAGAILQERKSGIWIRLASLPVSHLSLFAGKVLAYLGVGCCQFLLIGLIGRLLFPYLGLPAFAVSGSLAAILLVVLCASFAAIGFGIFLGVVCRSYQQASMLGATAVVAAAALGGIMVPVYAMPRVMQHFSLFSPLNWGLTAFNDLLVRGYFLSAIWDDLGKLTLFSLLTIFLAWRLARPRR